ncbi:metallophosphoesterase [Clostridium sp.]|uniref:metallophosphoesterase n=1 Tax=Clostridium sp. TaxID=1506 RepID=UPI002FC7A88A
MFKLLKILLATIASIILIIGCLFCYTTFIEPKLLITKTIDLSKGSNTDLKVVHFTDTQLGEYYDLDMLEKAVNKINAENPDIVVFTGDLIDNAAKYTHKDEIAPILNRIEAKLGKYAIYGNRDYGGSAVRYYKNIMKESGFKLLKNNSDVIELNGKRIRILGSDDALLGNPSIKSTTKGIKESDYNILLTHEPDIADKYSDYPIDLVLAGHSHGGQVYIPFYGPIKKNTLSEKYYKGMYTMDNSYKTKLYVNTGLGNTKVPFRFMNIPNVTLFNISLR